MPTKTNDRQKLNQLESEFGFYMNMSTEKGISLALDLTNASLVMVELLLIFEVLSIFTNVRKKDSSIPQALEKSIVESKPVFYYLRVCIIIRLY